MSSFSFIHTADLHLDSPFRNVRGNEALQSSLRDASITAFEALIAQAIDKSVNFVIFAGDIYDGEEAGLRAQFRFLEGLQRLSEAGIFSYILLGNHDPEKIFSAIREWPEGVHFFPADHVAEFHVEREGKAVACIRGRSYSPGTPAKEILDQFRMAENPNLFTIAVYHGDVQNSAGNNSEYAACSVPDLLSVPGINYWALGHLHQFQILRSERPAIVYPGTIQGRSLKPSECGDKGAVLICVDENMDAHVSFMPLSVISFRDISYSPQEATSVVALVKSIADNLRIQSQGYSSHSHCLRLTLTLGDGIAHLLSDYRKREEVMQMLGELLASSSIFLTETRFSFHRSADTGIINDILDACRKTLQEISDSGRDEFYSSLFSDERKLRFAPVPDDIGEIELDALTLISLALSSHADGVENA